VHGGKDRFVRYHERGTATLAHCVENQEIADRVRHADTGGDGPRVLPALGMAFAALERAHDRRAAIGLHREHARKYGCGPLSLSNRIECSMNLPRSGC